jgi:hypothetical protein
LVSYSANHIPVEPWDLSPYSKTTLLAPILNYSMNLPHWINKEITNFFIWILFIVMIVMSLPIQAKVNFDNI